MISSWDGKKLLNIRSENFNKNGHAGCPSYLLINFDAIFSSKNRQIP